VTSVQDEVLTHMVGIRIRVASSAGLQTVEGKFPMVKTRQCITRWPHCFNCETKVSINLLFMIRLILEKV
jgi:hypothetical protein